MTKATFSYDAKTDRHEQGTKPTEPPRPFLSGPVSVYINPSAEEEWKALPPELRRKIAARWAERYENAVKQCYRTLNEQTWPSGSDS
jgi:hypothetical protein